MLPRMAAFPGAAIVLAILGLNLLGDALNDLLNPKGYHSDGDLPA